MMLPGRLTEFEGLHKITRNKKTKYILLPVSQLPHPLHSIYLQTNQETIELLGVKDQEEPVEQ